MLEELPNDGVGGFSPGAPVGVPGLVEPTLATISRSGTEDAVAFVLDDGQLGVLEAGASAPVLSGVDLRSFASPAARSFAIDPATRLREHDVDGDGTPDLCIALVLDGGGGQRETVLVLLRGDPSGASGPFGYDHPDASTPVAAEPGVATGFVVADFAAALPGAEVALAFPFDGNHVRFYRYDAGGPEPTDDRFVRSFADPNVQALIAGEEPAQLAAADVDGNGFVDLAVASGEDSTFRLMLNTGDVDPQAPGEVNPAAFFEGPSPPPLPAGQPISLLSTDLDGDSIPDFVVTTEAATPARDHEVSVLVSDGSGGVTSFGALPSMRTGDTLPGPSGEVLRDAAMSIAIGDINGDGLPDLVIGWDDATPARRNVHVLFGGAR